MRILISALLLALSNHQKDSKCSSGDQLTPSYIPAGLQVLNHYRSQMQPELGRSLRAVAFRGGSNDSAPAVPDVPTIVVSFPEEDGDDGEDDAAPTTMRRLEKLVAALYRESDEQELEECEGFTTDVMRQLEKTSKSTAVEQLTFILEKISWEKVKRAETKELAKGVLLELEKCDSEFRKDLECVKPLKYLSDLSVE